MPSIALDALYRTRASTSIASDYRTCGGLVLALGQHMAVLEDSLLQKHLISERLNRPFPTV